MIWHGRDMLMAGYCKDYKYEVACTTRNSCEVGVIQRRRAEISFSMLRNDCKTFRLRKTRWSQY